MIPIEIATMTYEAQTSPKFAVLRVVGPLTYSTLERVENDFDFHLPKCRGKLTVLDLAQTPYISSTGWSFLLLAYTRVRAIGGELLLSSMNPEVLLIYEMLDFGTFIRNCSNMEEARVLCSEPTAARVKGEPGMADPAWARATKEKARASVPDRARRRPGRNN